MQVAIAPFPRTTALDSVGPYEVVIEYDPQPPFDSGAVAKAPEAALLRAQEYFTERS